MIYSEHTVTVDFFQAALKAHCSQVSNCFKVHALKQYCQSYITFYYDIYHHCYHIMYITTTVILNITHNEQSVKTPSKQMEHFKHSIQTFPPLSIVS